MLSGITVLERSQGIAAAYCGRLLADLGARVIMLEPPGGHPLRAEGPYRDDRLNTAYGGLFAYLSGGKESLTLHLDTADGIALLEGLAHHADVIIEEVAGPAVDGVRPRYERLQRANPAIVLTAISPFGLSGPRRCWQATPLTLFAMSSRMRVHGKPDRYPLQYAPDTVPFQAGATAAAATAIALVGAQASGVGRLVDVAVLEALIANVDVLTVLASFTGVLSARGLYPSQTYPCKDGFIILAFRDRDIAGIAQAMGRPELAADPRFCDRDAFTRHQDEFEALLLPWLVEHNRAELFALLQAHKVMCAPVFDFVEVLANPHYAARGFFRSVEDPVLGRVILPGLPFALGDGCNAGRSGPSPVPMPGAHNEAVYGSLLGLDGPTIMRLRAAHVI